MKILFLVKEGREKTYAHKRFIEEAKKENIEVWFAVSADFVVKSGELFYDNQKIKIPEIIIPRTSDGKALDLLDFFEDQGAFVLNKTESIKKTRDKFLTYEYLARFGLPTPKTKLLSEFVENKSKANFPLIIKKRIGSRGEWVFMIKSKQELDSFCESISNFSDFLVQDFVSDSFGRDVRVLILGDKILGVIERKSSDDFKANISRGGLAKTFVLSKKWQKIAISVVKSLGLNMAGVDFLFHKKGFLICEINFAPEFYGFEQATKTNVPKKVFDFFRANLSFLESK